VEPEPLAADRVRVRVKAMGLNRSDLLWIGAGFFKPDLPSRMGAEICGIVEETGAAVTGFTAGQRVSNLPLMYADIYSNFGAYADIPANALVPTPERLSDAEGAAFMFTHLTQMLGLAELGQLKPGQALLVTAASSANGLSALTIGRKLNAEIIAVTRSSSKRDMLLQAGAHHVIASGEEQVSARVMALTNGRGVDLAWDCVGGALSDEILRSMAPEGRWIMYGFLDPSPVTTQWAAWFARQITFHIFSMTQYTGNAQMRMLGRPNELKRAQDAVMALCGSGALRIPIAKIFNGLERVPDGLRLMETNQGGGKIVILA
jgi:NADPH:quinone reductase-like Zn-dependent oxidoreductase